MVAVMPSTLVPVGEHECATCELCACTFAIVHPACPRCSEQERILALLYGDSNWQLRVLIADLCDDHLDRSGALLGRVRELSLAMATGRLK